MMAPSPSSGHPPLAPLRRLVPIQPRPQDASNVGGLNAPAIHAHALAVAAAKAAQRRKHRLAVKRTYHAKLNGLSALREQERALEAQYEQLRTREPTATPTSPDETSCPDIDVEPTRRSAKALYLQLLDVRRALERENAALRDLTAQHEHFQTRLRLAAQAEGVVIDEDGDGYDEQDSESRDQAPLSAVVKQPPSAPVVTIKPLSLADCFEVIHETWPQVHAFMTSRHCLQLGSQVFGWTHKYRFPPSNNVNTAETTHAAGYRLQYSISKIFPSLSAYELSQRGWEIMTTQRHYEALHSSSMTSQMHLIQRVDNDNMVFLRILKRGGQSTVFKTLLLASQFQVDSGVLTIFRGLDPARVVGEDDARQSTQLPPLSTAVWLEMFAWTYFETQSDGQSVKFEFGGEMRHTSKDNARFWMMELLLMALRWENLAVGPLFTLTDA